MRILEVIVLIATASAFITLIVPRLRALRWCRLLPLLALVTSMAQAALEGARWQMIPLYTLSAVFLLISLWQRRASRPETERSSAAWRLLFGAGVGIGSIALLIAAALPILVPVFSFPRPTGPYAIGTLSYHWIDQTRSERFTATSGDKRELMVQLWYPAEPSTGLKPEPYVRPARSLAPLARALQLPGFFFDHFKYVSTNALQKAPIAEGTHNFPVLIFSHGRGGFQHNSFQIEELVSHGYIVATIDHPYAAAEVVFPDGRKAPFDTRLWQRPYLDAMTDYLGHDAVFARKQLIELNKNDPSGILTGRLNMEQVGMFGTSMGGLVTAEACQADPGFDACLIMDVFMPDDVVETGLRQPTMWISRGPESMQQEGWKTPEIVEHQESMRAVYNKLPGDGYLVLVDGMFHVNISDFPYFLSTPAARALGAIGPADWRNIHAIINRYSLAFFDKYLKGKHKGLLDKPRDLPGVELESRQSQ